jgi:hypothetical protein
MFMDNLQFYYVLYVCWCMYMYMYMYMYMCMCDCTLQFKGTKCREPSATKR